MRQGWGFRRDYIHICCSKGDFAYDEKNNAAYRVSDNGIWVSYRRVGLLDCPEPIRTYIKKWHLENGQS